MARTRGRVVGENRRRKILPSLFVVSGRRGGRDDVGSRGRGGLFFLAKGFRRGDERWSRVDRGDSRGRGHGRRNDCGWRLHDRWRLRGGKAERGRADRREIRRGRVTDSGRAVRRFDRKRPSPTGMEAGAEEGHEHQRSDASTPAPFRPVERVVARLHVTDDSPVSWVENETHLNNGTPPACLEAKAPRGFRRAVSRDRAVRAGSGQVRPACRAWPCSRAGRGCEVGPGHPR